jgi:hypothetical protein
MLLFASRKLDLLYLDPIFHSPSLHGSPLQWYWRCDLTYLSWLVDRAGRVRSTPEQQFRIDWITSYIQHTHGITDDDASRLLPPGAKLDTSLPLASVGLCDRYAGPEWPGIVEAAEAAKYENPLNKEALDPASYRDVMRGFAYKKRGSS